MDSEKVSIRDPVIEDTEIDEKKTKKKNIIKALVIVGIILVVIGIGLVLFFTLYNND